MRQPGLANSLLGGLVAEDDVIDGGIESGLLNTQSCRGVALRVQIHQEGRALGKGEAGREVDGGGRLPNAAFLIDDREDPSYWSVPRTTLPIT